MALDVTVVVSTYNRTSVLERCLEALERQGAERIVVLDNGSTLPEALALLERLKAGGTTVYRRDPIGVYEDLEENIDAVLKLEAALYGTPRWWAVTDADVILDGSERSIEAYIAVANDAERDVAVGPHLRPNVSPNYPLRTRVLVQQTPVLYAETMTRLPDDLLGEIPWSWVPLDTTFQILPGERVAYRRFALDAIRVGPPFWATHLDWTIDGLAPTEEDLAYATSPGDRGSWGKTWIAGIIELLFRSRELAFATTAAAAAAYADGDYSNDRFLLSWMLQYGIGCAADREASAAALRSALPERSPCWRRRKDWDALVYEDDLSPLGWGDLA